MFANYHTHTPLCNHATGSVREYIEAAIKCGIEKLGFSDHAPFYFIGDYISGCRMEMDKIDLYFDTILALREKYKDHIDIKIGFEIEYYPKFWDKALEKYRQYPLDYLILGNHFLGNESIEMLPISAPTSEEALLARYVDECIAAMKTDRITYLCHPDMINFTGDEQTYVKHFTRLISEAKALDIPLEINLLGKRAGRHYPRDLFWETAAKLGAKAIIGCDAHAPEHVGVKEEIENALRYADKLGIEVLRDVKLKNPIF